MEQNNQNQPAADPNNSAEFGNVRKNSEGFRSVPNGSEPFRTVRNDAEGFRSVPNPSERKENHTLTVREAARQFEAAGVARTERSIVNWCQPNKMGIPRLDSYFDPNERKYFITPQSVGLAIAEEKARAAKINESSEPVGAVPKGSEKPQDPFPVNSEADSGRTRELEKQVLDLKITNRGKDYFIEQLQKERDGFIQEVVKANRKVDELETRLLQLERPKGNTPGTAEQV
jgi:hypothetical protein